MTQLSEKVLAACAPWRLLSHPFYKAWECGMVPMEALKTYARQYYHHVEAFPRYLSATHSRCTNIEARQELLKNLIDEEHGPGNHPGVWMKFAEGLGNTKAEVKSEQLLPETQGLIDTFMQVSSSSYGEGLAALYMYEEQTPEIAATKMEGLKKHYGITNRGTLGYFALHKELDVEHAAATAALLNDLPESEHEQAIEAAKQSAQALWKFLDRMETLVH